MENKPRGARQPHSKPVVIELEVLYSFIGSSVLAKLGTNGTISRGPHDPSIRTTRAFRSAELDNLTTH